MHRYFILIFLFYITSCSHITKRIQVIAHRGASGYLPEHSLPAVAMAHSWDVDFIEPDIVLTKDSIPIIMHDIYLDTTTDVKSIYPHRHRKDGRFYVIDFTLKEIKRLTLHERVNLKTQHPVFPHRFPPMDLDLKIPTLEEYISFIQGLNRSRKKNIGLIPEIKSPAFHRHSGRDISRIVLNTLQKFKLNKKSEQLYLQCFDPQELKRIRFQLRSPINLVQLTGPNSWHEADCDYDQIMNPQGLKKVAQYAQVISPWLNPFIQQHNLPEFTTMAHQVGLKVIPYTIRVDDLPYGIKEEQLYDYLRASKIDGIFSDFADRTLLFL